MIKILHIVFSNSIDLIVNNHEIILIINSNLSYISINDKLNIKMKLILTIWL